MLLAKIEGRVAASAGSACHATEADAPVHLSHVLAAMGSPVEWGMGTLRLSVGRYSTDAEIDEAAEVIIREAKALLA